MQVPLISLEQITRARNVIAPYINQTPLVPLANGLQIKAESLHPTGAFKLRGAFNALLSLTSEAKAAGVVAHSSGNHAQAVAWAAARLGIRAILVMPANAPETKVAGVRRAGGEIVTVGTASAERAAKADELAASQGLTLIPPFDHPAILAGTGTIGLEILDQAPDAACIFAPVSGGGLLGGLAAAIKLSRPGIKVIGCEPELAADAFASFQAGRIVSITAEEAGRTSADGLRVQRLGALTWPHIAAYVDDIITVSETAIFDAMRHLAFDARLVAEPSGAVSVAAALAAGAGPGGVAVLSGGNVDPAAYAAVLAGAV